MKEGLANVLLPLTFLLTLFFSVWELSLIQIRKWEYLKILKSRGPERHLRLKKPEDSLILIKNIKLFFFILCLLLFIFRFPNLGSWSFFGILALGYLVLFVIVPFFIHADNSPPLVSFLLPLQHFLHFLFAPLFLFRREEAEEEDREEQVEAYLFEGRERDVFSPEEEEMVENILYFKETTAREIMTPRVNIVGVSESATLTEVRALILEAKKSKIPVYRETVDDIVGILDAKSLLKYEISEKLTLKETKDLLKKPLFVTEYMKLTTLLSLLQKKKQKFAAVIDEYGGVSGILTVEDIVEEIVGEIYDEDEKEECTVHKTAEGFLVSGETSVENVEELLDHEFSVDAAAVTIGGMITFLLGKIPSPGERLELEGYEFLVKEVSDKNIESLLIRPAEKEKREEEASEAN